MAILLCTATFVHITIWRQTNKVVDWPHATLPYRWGGGLCTLQQKFHHDGGKWGFISWNLFAQLKPGEFKAAMTHDKPAVLICSAEFLSSKEVGISLFGDTFRWWDKMGKTALARGGGGLTLPNFMKLLFCLIWRSSLWNPRCVKCSSPVA